MILFSSTKRREREAAGRLYRAALQASRHPALYTELGVPDTLQGRFEMLALHLFALTDRLMHGADADAELARLVAESFVADMDGAFREMGVSDIAVPKRMKVLYRSFAGRAGAYRAALQDGDAALEAALARNVFPDGDKGRRALGLAMHLKRTVAAMREADVAELRRGEAPFAEPSHPYEQQR